MVIIMKSLAKKEEVDFVIDFVKRNYGLRVDISKGEFQSILGLIGDESKVDFDRLDMLPGVERAQRIQVPYKLVTRSYNPEDKVITVKGVKIGGHERPVFIAGPCSIA